MTRTFLVADHGSFLPLARALAKGGDHVLYHRLDWQCAFPVVNEGIVGDGFEDIQNVPDLWSVVNEVDCFVFPDIYHAGLQKQLRAMGKPVWGAGDGMNIETDREYFLEKLGEFKLDVPEYTPVKGMTNLRLFLKDKEDIWIKLSRWRGSFETKHFRNMDEDAGLLDSWTVKFGGIKEHLTFLCFNKIDTTLEIGADTYCIDGQWPSVMLQGYEAKDEAYFSAVTKREDMPNELLPIMEAFSPYLKETQYRQQWSMEVRVSKDGNYFIDPTCRGGLPSTASQCLAITNLGDVIFYGARGEMVDPEYNCKFTAEALVKTSAAEGEWYTLNIPPELRDNLLLSSCCEIEGRPWWPPDQAPIADECGWLVATGDTPREVLEQMNELSEMLPDGANANVEALAMVIREIEDGREEGISFTKAVLPPAEIVLEEV